MIHTISSITVFLCLFLAFYLATVRSDHKLTNYLFSAFLILQAVDTSGILIESLEEKPLNLIIFRSTFSFCQLPILYLYVRSVCYADFKLKPIHLIHLLPFVLANLAFGPRFYLVETVDKVHFLEQYKHMFEIQLNHILFHLQFLGYGIVIFLNIRSNKTIYLENYSGEGLKVYGWLAKFTLSLFILYGIALVKNLIKFSDFALVSEYFKIGIHVMFFLLACWYLYKALSNGELFTNTRSSLKPIKHSLPLDEVENLELRDREQINRLKSYMQETQPYLNPSLTIQNVSDEVDIPVRDLSLLINHKLDQHFYDFVNSYRINYAKDLLGDLEQKGRTVLEILYDAGFNSKSSFNTAFKKETGITPSMYRKSLKNN